MIGDVVGKPGRRIVANVLPGLQREEGIDLVIANVENVAGGHGVTPQAAEEMFRMGVDILTTGNHIWDKKEVEPYLEKEKRLLRPANYPEENPGAGVALVEKRERRVGVLNLQGRAFMPTIDCPFQVGERKLALLREVTDLIVVDFHAEATAEKQAFAWYVAGRVSAVVGTHTHVQTADERILLGGTAYITDVGMTGPTDSVIGVEKEGAIRRFVTQRPVKFTPASGPVQFCAVLVDVHDATGRATGIRRIQIHRDGGVD